VAINAVHCQPSLPADEVARIASSAARFAPSARCSACGAPLPQDDVRATEHRDEEVLMARALGVVLR
jgi:hypothetical protein